MLWAVCDTRTQLGWGCHRPVSLGVVLAVLYRLGVVLISVIYW
eukprot:COSAG01_NODE_1578_length_9832_cov_75.363403_9_plen_43_part_00